MAVPLVTMILINLAIGLALSVVGYLLAPRPKPPKPGEAAQMNDPVAEAGKPIPVVFGTITVKEPNVLWFGEKSKEMK